MPAHAALADFAPLQELSQILSGRLAPAAVRDERWPELCTLALQHSVGPYLLWRLAEAEATTLCGNSWTQRLKAKSRWTALEQIRLDIALAEVDAAFRSAGIFAIWLKGIALARTVYPQPLLRPMGDLDTLIPYDQRKQALEIALQLGYVPGSERGVGLLDSQDELKDALTHHDHLHSPQHRVILELHFQFARTLLSLEHMAWFYSQTERTDDDLLILRSEAHLLYLCAHATLQHGETDFRLVRYLDLHLLISEKKINWNIVIERAVELGWSYAVERSLRVAVMHFSTAVPDDVFEQLTKRRLGHDMVTVAMEIRDAGARWSKVRRELSLLPFKQQARLAWRIAVPSKAYMRERYADRPLTFAALLYPYRWLDQSHEFVKWAQGRMSERVRKHGRT
jgi:hypothetical protein